MQLSAPDVTPIINVLQQVSTPENNAVIQFPKRINTHRHTYSLLLDMLGYISADIMSADSEVPVTFTGQPERKYLHNANGATTVVFEFFSTSKRMIKHVYLQARDWL